MSLELKKAIEQISKDRGLDRDMLVSTLEEAVRTSVIRKYGDDLDVEVRYSDDTGEIEVFQFKFVVEEVENPLTQISLEEARQHDASIQLEDEMGFRLKVEDLGRIAAQSAKQVIIQRMRDAEQELIYDEFEELLFPHDPIGRNILGTEQSLETFNSERIQAFVRRNYTPDRMVVFAMGNIKPNWLIKKVEKYFTNINTSPMTKKVLESQNNILNPQISTFNFQLSTLNSQLL